MATTVSNVNFRLKDVKYFDGTIKNATGSEVTLNEGSLLLFDKSDEKYYAYPENSILKPVAIVAYDTTIGATSEVTGNVCVWGDVNSSALDLPGSYTIDSVPVSSTDAIAIGTNSQASASNAVALGPGAIADEADEIVFGTASSTVNIPGALYVNGAEITGGGGGFDATADPIEIGSSSNGWKTGDVAIGTGAVSGYM